jgi:uncharacterized protein YjiS (DUF1127 family)
VTDVGVHPITFASGATERVRRFAAHLERSVRNETLARSTYYALEELPDEVLRDFGIARSEIPFVACSLAARHGNTDGDALHRSTMKRDPASRLALVAVVAVSTFVIAACTVLARDAKMERGEPDVMRLLGGPEVDFPRSVGTTARQLLF